MEITIARLPLPLKKAVESCIGSAREEFASDELSLLDRWQDSDFWMLYRHEDLPGQEPGTLTRRVAIGAFSDEPETLLILSDILVEQRGTTFRIQDQVAEEMEVRVPLPILAATADMGAYWLLTPMPHGLSGWRDDLTRKLMAAWNEVKELEPSSATVRVR